VEKVIDRIIEELNLLKDRTYEEGGFSDEIDLVGDVWWGDPGILDADQYPFVFVAPDTSEPDGGTTANTKRTLTIRIGILIDPREYYDTTETVEATASRELVRLIESIEQHFERKTIRMPGGLGEGTLGVEVGTTAYAIQLRGDLYAQSAQLTLSVDRQRPRLN
jgi:hypothetical protein